MSEEGKQALISNLGSSLLQPGVSKKPQHENTNEAPTEVCVVMTGAAERWFDHISEGETSKYEHQVSNESDCGKKTTHNLWLLLRKTKL
jgi:hypothetical protein